LLLWKDGAPSCFDTLTGEWIWKRERIPVGCYEWKNHFERAHRFFPLTYKQLSCWPTSLNSYSKVQIVDGLSRNDYLKIEMNRYAYSANGRFIIYTPRAKPPGIWNIHARKWLPAAWFASSGQRVTILDCDAGEIIFDENTHNHQFAIVEDGKSVI